MKKVLIIICILSILLATGCSNKLLVTNTLLTKSNTSILNIVHNATDLVNYYNKSESDSKYLYNNFSNAPSVVNMSSSNLSVSSLSVGGTQQVGYNTTIRGSVYFANGIAVASGYGTFPSIYSTHLYDGSSSLNSRIRHGGSAKSITFNTDNVDRVVVNNSGLYSNNMISNITYNNYQCFSNSTHSCAIRIYLNESNHLIAEWS